MYQVEPVQPRGEEFPGQQLTVQVEAGSVRGWKLVSVVPLFDVILLVWDKPDEEKRESR